MKTLITLAILMVFAFSIGWAQDNALYVGAGNNDGFAVTGGAIKRAGGNFWVFPRADLQFPYGSVSLNSAYIQPVYKGLSIGVVGGPDIDIDVTTYVLGASGVLVTYDFGPVGLWSGAKYEFSLRSTDSYDDSWAAFAGAFIWL